MEDDDIQYRPARKQGIRRRTHSGDSPHGWSGLEVTQSTVPKAGSTETDVPASEGVMEEERRFRKTLKRKK